MVERIINSFPHVRESAVIGIADLKKGEQVVAVVVADGDLVIDELKKHCLENMVNYQVPTRYELVDELPRNTMGKILKRELRAALETENS